MTNPIPANIIEIESANSTNDYLINQAENNELDNFTTIVAEEQLNGKGQIGNSWESEKNKNLTFSIYTKPAIEIQDMFLISKSISISLIKSLLTYNIKAKIKWPNDIYVDDKKIAGILIENQFIGSKIKHSIIGVGLNINQTVFKSDAPNPISMKNLTSIELSTNEVLSNILLAFTNTYTQLKNSSYDALNSEYFNNLYRQNSFHKYKENGLVFEAQIIDVKNDGQLLLKTKADEIKAYYFKEVEFIF